MVGLIELFYSIPGWLATFLLAMSPVFELRGAIPLAIGVYGIPPLEAYAISVVGNLVPVVLLLLFLEPVSLRLMRYRPGKVFFSWLFSRTYRNHVERHRKYGLLALIFFVSLPLPVTGAWTGSAIAFIFGLKFREAFPAIAIGVLIAGAVVTASVVGVITFAFS
ncbi:MAG: Putative small multi-drug export protein [Methanothrix sp.]|nr:MAG: Putative small multi-drug export protein [Methanothrix sp.]